MPREGLDQHSIVGLERKWAEGQSSLHHPPASTETGPRAGEHAQLPIEGEEADAVPVLLRGARQGNRAIDRIVEFRGSLDAAGHQAAGVHRDHHRVMTLGLVLAHYESSAT